MTGRSGGHAIVIGAGIAGLASAAVLAEHFDSVSILDGDAIDDRTRERRAIAQGPHLHTLLRGGQAALAAIYPELIGRLRATGAARFRVGLEGVIHCPDGPFYNFACTVSRPFDFGVELHNQSRGLLEQTLRRLALERANVGLRTSTSVDALIGDRRRVRGVRVRADDGESVLDADLIVVTSGRTSQVGRWLEQLGAIPPRETTIGVDFAYASTKFRIPAGYDEPYRMMACHGPAPRFATAAALLEIENRVWHVSAAGRFAAKPPTDPAGFMHFVASLPSPKLHALLARAERLDDIKPYRFPASIRRHFEQLHEFPDGSLVIGDALCSVNPVYGQGMSTAAAEALIIGELLDARAAAARGLEGLAPAFFAMAARLSDTPWSLAATADFLYPQTVGKRPRFMMFRRHYLGGLNRLAAEDPALNQLITEVFHLSKPIASLHTGSLRRRALFRIAIDQFSRASRPR